MAQCQRGGREDRDRRAGIALAGEDVENDIGGMNAVGDRFRTSRLDRRQPVGEHRGENVDHLTIAIVDAGELAPHALHRGRQYPVFEGRTVAQRTRLAGEHRHVVPRIVDRPATAKRSGMFGDDPPFLAGHDAVGIGMDFDGTPDGVGGHGVFVVVEAHQAVFETDAGTEWKPSNRPV